ncbi:MAG: sigma-54 dependent transcriptional regulator [Alkalispirochaeta sp.]
MDEKSTAILIVDDDPVALELIEVNLRGLGFGAILTADSGEQALRIVRERSVAAVVLDLFMPGISGFDVLERMNEELPWIPVIVVTVSDSVDAAVQCMRHGAFDFMTKPLDRNRLGSAVNHAIRVRDLEGRLELLRDTAEDIEGPSNRQAFAGIITVSPRMKATFQYVEAIASSPHAVLITGESGTGKELIARAVHDVGGREGPFVPINVAGLDDVMFTDTLFGHRRGAFTGADHNRGGLVERAQGGTLFLDEIGDMEINSQIKLLRLLQEGEYYPLGSDEPAHARVRIVAATNADLVEKQRQGLFRKDLYYRLISHLITVPPLRERPEDIPVLADHFAEEAARSIGKPKPRINPAVEDILRQYAFPGNVRELQSMMADAVSRTRGDALPVSVLREYLDRSSDADHALGASDTGRGGGDRFSWRGPFPALEEVVEFLITEALRRSDYNQTAAARLLGISQSTLSRRLSSKR